MEKTVGKMISGCDHALGKIFNSDFEFEIPSYQRPYAWGVTQAEELFNDLNSFHASSNENEGYFLGSIVLIKDEGCPRSQVVDGQQRLTTLTILLAVIASRMKDECRDECWSLIREKGSLVHKLSPKPRLKLRERDNDFFCKYIQGLLIDDLVQLPDNQLGENEVKRHIRDNAKAFLGCMSNTFGDDKYKLLCFLQFIVNRCFLVVVSTPSRQSAFRIFSVLNNRGLDLLPTDIIKSEMIGNIADADQGRYTEKWEDIEDATGRDDFCALFGHIRTIFAKAKAKRMLNDEFAEFVIPRIVSATNFIDNILSPYADAYRVVTRHGYQSSGDAMRVNELLVWLGKVNNADWIPPAIYFLSQNHSDEEVFSFFMKLERLVAFMHICGWNVNHRIDRFSRIIQELETGNALNSLELNEEEKRNFLETLDGNIYGLTGIRRNYVILRLDSFENDNAASYAPATLTIEHVLPQTPKEGGQWMEWWPDAEMRKAWTHRVANLVPLTRAKNSAAQNFEFDVKKDKYFRSKQGISSYGLTTWVLSTPKWTPDVLQDRQQHLMQTFKREWDL